MRNALARQDVIRIQTSAECLYSESEVDSALDEMAKDVTQVLEQTQPLILCTMIGGIITTGKLLARLDFPLSVDYIHASRYRGSLQGAELNWIARPTESLKGRVVLIVDDIFDEGLTLQALVEDCSAAGATHVYTAVLLDKSCKKKSDVNVDFVGLRVDDRYVFGSGMDYKGFLRNVPGIYAVTEVE